MYLGRFVFSQVIAHLPMSAFRTCVKRYHGNRKIKRFTCLDQFLCMALTFRQSLRDIIVKKRLKPDASLYTILQVLSVTVFNKTPISRMFTENVYRNQIIANDNQLSLFD